MNQEFEQSRSAKQAGKDQQWLKTDLSDLFDGEKSNQLFSELKSQKEIVPVEKEKETICAFPDFGAATLKGKGVAKLNGRLREELRDSLQGLGTLPSLEIFKKQEAIWRRVVMATETFYTTSCLKGTLSKLTEEAQTDEKKKDQEQENATKKQTMTSNDVLIEVGVKTSLSLVFSLLKQVWGQLSWQRQLHTLLTNSGSLDVSLLPYPEVQLPYDVLQSVIDVLRSLPPLSLNKSTSLSPLGQFSLDKGHEFLKWLLDPTSGTDDSTHRLAMEISLLLSLHEGTLTSLLKWFNFCFSCLSSYPLDVPLPSLSHDVCSYAISEIQKQTNTDESRDLKSFVPIETTSAGHVSLIEFISFLAEDLYDACKVCTETFCGDGASNKPPALQQGKYISTKCDVYAFGSNSSSQLAMGSTEKFMKATLLTHMANAQFIEAGQYCTFLIFSDGSMKGCGKVTPSSHAPLITPLTIGQLW
jgi:E3 ubiquitin-protein ligase HERC1